MSCGAGGALGEVSGETDLLQFKENVLSPHTRMQSDRPEEVHALITENTQLRAEINQLRSKAGQ